MSEVFRSGTEERGDILIQIEPLTNQPFAACENQIEVRSRYESLFGEHLRRLVDRLIAESGLKGYRIFASDSGAWDYTIKARFESCLRALNRSNT
ncbi:MAG: citrate lyase acyl carrier protein [Thermotogaceae bacterium]|nr:citrate lyase acyl carrier protein [Thermotogaceae bacterium]